MSDHTHTHTRWTDWTVLFVAVSRQLWSLPGRPFLRVLALNILQTRVSVCVVCVIDFFGSIRILVFIEEIASITEEHQSENGRNAIPETPSCAINEELCSFVFPLPRLSVGPKDRWTNKKLKILWYIHYRNTCLIYSAKGGYCSSLIKAQSRGGEHFKQTDETSFLVKENKQQRIH